ncbi:hypothetical protein [Candidatus Xianfuyuplasma coldseepsis]|uniref:Uncharacterized protein n=1 Tax=Candidatus Xianfuyuplasma coldseepsis TaxID=2782163 RepID=A0A7L7KRU0_9MOLU|nr:hypothetical protein [Xianfuyuplasma coldseepsis]QMS85315.1 hypothetical protein G4Z02_05965 [Xianfuyuplasma coldseepsis]
MKSMTMKKVLMITLFIMIMIGYSQYQDNQVFANTTISIEDHLIESDDSKDAVVAIPVKFEEDEYSGGEVFTLVHTTSKGEGLCIEYTEMSIINDVINTNIIGSSEYYFARNK